jgi:tetratricopeptide (TPR) repeat protein
MMHAGFSRCAARGSALVLVRRLLRMVTRAGRAWGIGVGLVVALLLLAPSAMADDLIDFEHARALYTKRNYSGAMHALQELVGSDPPRVTERLLVLESRKYLAASLLFLGKRDEARAQFRLLLAQEPNYAIDPLAFPTEVVTLFEKVKADLMAQLEEARAEQQRRRDEEQRLAQERARKEQENLERLFRLAQESQTRSENSRWIATIPFGVGQFQNGHKSLGMALAVLEGLAAGASIATFIGHQQVADDKPSRAEQREADRVEEVWRVSNQASFGVFIALALIGIIDAHVRFVPARVRSEPRNLPPDLKRWAEEHKLGLDASGVHLRF